MHAYIRNSGEVRETLAMPRTKPSPMDVRRVEAMLATKQPRWARLCNSNRRRTLTLSGWSNPPNESLRPPTPNPERAMAKGKHLAETTQGEDKVSYLPCESDEEDRQSTQACFPYQWLPRPCCCRKTMNLKLKKCYGDSIQQQADSTVNIVEEAIDLTSCEKPEDQ